MFLTHKQCQECIGEIEILQHWVWYSIMLAVGWSTSLVSRTRLEWCLYMVSGRSCLCHHNICHHCSFHVL